MCVCLLMKQCAIGVDYDRSAELKVYMLFLGVCEASLYIWLLEMRYI